MALPDLTGQNIENTYQRVLQTDGINVYNGTGSLVTLQYTGSFTGDGSGLTGITAVAAPAGPDQSIQFNDGGATSGSGNFTFDKTINVVLLSGSLIVSNSLDTEQRFLYDTANNLAANWEDRRLLGITQEVVVDWGVTLLNDLSEAISVDWTNRQLYDSNSTLVLDYSSLVLNDGAGINSVNWERRKLLDPNNTESIDWNSRVTNDITGVTSINWQDRRLFDLNVTRSIDWNNRRAYDLNDVISFNWRDRLLQSPNGNTLLDWNTNGSITITGNLSVTGTIDGGTF
jgi:hypothetical protein